MEPSKKKRKLAPKLSPSAPPPQHSLDAHNTQQGQPPPPPQLQPQARHTPQPPGCLPTQPHYSGQEQPPPERHDFEAFARHLQDAAMLIQRQTESPPYADVSVLLLNWEDGQAPDQHLVALERVFQKQYGFQCHTWSVPTVPDPGTKLAVRLASFLENASVSHLFVIVYAGHSYLDADGQLYWARHPRDEVARLRWDGVSCLVEDTQSDVLLLLDTCAPPELPMSSSLATKQVITAFPAAHKSSHELPDGSFISNLTEALHRLSRRRAFSVQRLYEELCKQRQLQLAQDSRSVNGASASHSPLPSRLPELFTLAFGKKQCLVLGPLSPGATPLALQNGAEIMDSGAARAHEEDLISPESVIDLRFDEARVLVCTTFVGDASPDMSYFNKWLQDTPLLGGSIAVEGMFLGPPTMLLISMPHAIWNVVQHDKVCCFLGYISSHNMIHLYQKLVGLVVVKPSSKAVADGRTLLEARDTATTSASRARHDGKEHAADAQSHHNLHSSASLARFPRSTEDPSRQRLKPGVEDSAEMKEAAEQLKALSHVRHRSDETQHSATLGRRRTTLPDGSPKRRRSDLGTPSNESQVAENDAVMSDFKVSPKAADKAARQDTRCIHCRHAPFKDSSSLRKHISAVHTRPFPCAFSFAGCTSTFGSKNEWKRHISSQHLCLQYYRCSLCPQSAADGKANEFNRKDLFTQHLRRMHAPSQIKRAITKGDSPLQSDWDKRVKDMQQSCLVTRRLPPQKSACPKPGCTSTFEGPGAWDEWTEHVGRHMERREADQLGVDGLLVDWALREGILEGPFEGGDYRFMASHGVGGSDGRRFSLENDNFASAGGADASDLGNGSMLEIKQREDLVKAGA